MKHRKALKTGMVLAVLLVVSCCVALTTSQQKAPVMSDVRIEPPGPALPDEVKALSGTWAGEWNSRLGWDCLLYVEQIDNETARLVHSFGEYTTANGSCHCAPDWRRVERAKVSRAAGTVTLEFEVHPYRPLKGPGASHSVSGSVEGLPKRAMRKGSSGRYTFSFTLDKNEPGVLKGHFISSQASHLRAELKKID